jgi:hypothetical protein
MVVVPEKKIVLAQSLTLLKVQLYLGRVREPAGFPKILTSSFSKPRQLPDRSRKRSANSASFGWAGIHFSRPVCLLAVAGLVLC